MIHLRESPSGDWEILSVVPEGGRPIAGLVTTGSIMTVEGSPQAVYDFLNGRANLGNLPKAWTKKLSAGAAVSVRLEEIEGYLK